METIKSILQKIEMLSSSDAVISNIERDLMLQHTRNLYELLLHLDTNPEIVEDKTEEIVEEEVMQTEESAPTIMPEAEESANEQIELETYSEQEPEGHQANVFEEAPTSIVEDFQEEEDKVIELDIEADEIEERFNADEIDFREDKEVDFEVEEREKEEEDVEIEPKQENLFLQEPVVEKPTASEARSITDFKVWSKDIRSYIGINDKYNFISELFGNNPEAYDEILNELNLCENKTEALQFLENSGITTLYQWKEDGFSEQIFYNVLSQFFSSR